MEQTIHITKDNVRDLPTLPGVYLFKDAHNRILYIGKATSLRDRVRSYFAANNREWKVDELLNRYAYVTYIITETATEAALLEAHLIHHYDPHYNQELKQGNPFIYLVFTKEEPAELKLVRNKQETGIYFGPFIKKRDARAVYIYLMQTFRLHKCKRSIPGGCLKFHLGYCAGTCTDTFDQYEYATRLQLAQQALKGNREKYLTTVNQAITDYNAAYEFEKAAHLHTYVQHLTHIFKALETRYHHRKYEAEINRVILGHTKATPPHEGLIALQKHLNLETAPRTIDCFDISHYQSSHIVGSCIRFTDGVPDKENFRRFSIRSLTIQNDYAALQEIVHRRYRNTPPADVIVIDGGKGQRNAIKALMPHTPCVSIAKRHELLISDTAPEGTPLDPHTSLGKLLLAIRDYAHHFAITYHRTKRTRVFAPKTKKSKK